MKAAAVCHHVLLLVIVSSTDASSRSNTVDVDTAAVAGTNAPNALVVGTWAAQCFQDAVGAAWSNLMSTGDRLDAVVAGCSSAEAAQCDSTVGFGNSPDESGESTLDSLIMDGVGHRLGAVCNLRQVKNAIGVARAVMDHTTHSVLAGEAASRFAVEMGFPMEDLHTPASWRDWQTWRDNRCQPNHRTVDEFTLKMKLFFILENVSPDPTTSCGPYKPLSAAASSTTTVNEQQQQRSNSVIGKGNHDTIGLIVIDDNGDLAVGTSTNGVDHKVPGRVADSGLVGAGAYVDNEVGAAAATGDGDLMMRTLPSYQCVESMRLGMTPAAAAADAIARLVKVNTAFSGAVVCANKNRIFGAACHNIGVWQYSYQNATADGVLLAEVKCT